jgi:hypothetical protein
MSVPFLLRLGRASCRNAAQLFTDFKRSRFLPIASQKSITPNGHNNATSQAAARLLSLFAGNGHLAGGRAAGESSRMGGAATHRFPLCCLALLMACASAFAICPCGKICAMAKHKCIARDCPARRPHPTATAKPAVASQADAVASRAVLVAEVDLPGEAPEGVAACRYEHSKVNPWIILPDKSCTPGAPHAVSRAEVEKKSKAFRNVPESEKKQVCEYYGATDCPDVKAGEEDHLCPVALCHSNDIDNLWWQPAPQYHQKDRVEAKLIEMVRKGQVTPETARKALESDWSVAYQKYVGPLPKGN